MIGFPKNPTEFSNFIKKRETQGFISKNKTKKFLDQGSVYLKQGLPHFKTEGWRYFPFNKIKKTDYIFSEEIKETLFSKEKFEKIKGVKTLFVVNGEVQAHSAIKGLSLFSWNDFITEKVKLDSKFEKQINESITKQRDSLCALNNALSLNGLILVIEEDLECPIEIRYIQNLKEQGHRALNLRSFIFVKKNAKATVLESFYGSLYSSNKNLLFNLQTDGFLESHSDLKYIRFDQGEGSDVQFNQFFAHLEPKAKINSITLSFNSGVSHYLSHIHEEESAEATVKSLSILGEKKHVDHKVTVFHSDKNSKSSQWYQSLLFDSSQHIFNGKIHIDQKAQKSDAKQMNKNYLLGSKSHAVSLPELQVLADDVKAFHGASVSSPEENQDMIFYLQSRGLSRAQALSLILSGLIKEALSLVEEGHLKSYLMEYSHSHLNFFTKKIV